jgi:hypothetical protein
MGYLDMGIASKLSKARDMFPKARRAVVYPPGRLSEASGEAIRQDLDRLGRELAPCDVVLADIPWNTPDSAVNWFVQTCRSVEAELSFVRPVMQGVSS